VCRNPNNRLPTRADGTRRVPATIPSMAELSRLYVLYEDNHLLVVSKPPGISTQGAPGNTDSLLARARRYLKQKYQKPGNVYLGVVSRLDSPVSGVMVLARTSKAARRLNDQFRSRSVLKRYWALVEGHPSPASGECVDWLRHDERHRRMEVSQPGAKAAQEARLVYRLLRTISGVSLVEVELQTGRKHQIRVQFAVRGWPIVGDRKYGSRLAFPGGIALHSRSLTFVHPTRGESMEFVAPVPRSWAAFGMRETR
jgi:23S rRNA pseudouridine1911/1915/1917 synthase